MNKEEVKETLLEITRNDSNVWQNGFISGGGVTLSWDCCDIVADKINTKLNRLSKKTLVKIFNQYQTNKVK